MGSPDLNEAGTALARLDKEAALKDTDKTTDGGDEQQD